MGENAQTKWGQIHDHTWKYFKLFGSQRLITFRYYLVLCTLISAALTSIVNSGGDMRVGIPLALLLPIFSFIFWKLDLRNKQFIGHAEDAMKCIERECCINSESCDVNKLKVFNIEENATRQNKKNPLFFTYSTCFNLIFLIFSFGGVAASVWFLVNCNLHYHLNQMK